LLGNDIAPVPYTVRRLRVYGSVYVATVYAIRL